MSRNLSILFGVFALTALEIHAVSPVPAAPSLNEQSILPNLGVIAPPAENQASESLPIAQRTPPTTDTKGQARKGKKQAGASSKATSRTTAGGEKKTTKRAAGKKTAGKKTARKGTKKTARGKTAKQKAAAEKAAAEKAAAEKADKEKADKEKADKEKADKEKTDKEKTDKEKTDKEKADKEKADKEKTDKEKADKAAADKKAAEDKAAADKKAAEDKASADQAAADKKAAEDKAAADKKAAEDKASADQAATEQAAKDKAAAAEQAAKEKADIVAQQKADKEKADKIEQEKTDKVAQEKADKEKADKVAREKADKEAADKLEQERAEKEKADTVAQEKAAAAEQAAKDRLAWATNPANANPADVTQRLNVEMSSFKSTYKSKIDQYNEDVARLKVISLRFSSYSDLFIAASKKINDAAKVVGNAKITQGQTIMDQAIQSGDATLYQVGAQLKAQGEEFIAYNALSEGHALVNLPKTYDDITTPPAPPPPLAPRERKPKLTPMEKYLTKYYYPGTRLTKEELISYIDSRNDAYSFARFNMEDAQAMYVEAANKAAQEGLFSPNSPKAKAAKKAKEKARQNYVGAVESYAAVTDDLSKQLLEMDQNYFRNQADTGSETDMAWVAHGMVWRGNHAKDELKKLSGVKLPKSGSYQLPEPYMYDKYRMPESETW